MIPLLHFIIIHRTRLFHYYFESSTCKDTPEALRLFPPSSTSLSVRTRVPLLRFSIGKFLFRYIDWKYNDSLDWSSSIKPKGGCLYPDQFVMNRVFSPQSFSTCKNKQFFPSLQNPFFIKRAPNIFFCVIYKRLRLSFRPLLLFSTILRRLLDQFDGIPNLLL